MNLQKIKPEKLYDQSEYHSNIVLLFIVLPVIDTEMLFFEIYKFMLFLICNSYYK